MTGTRARTTSPVTPVDRAFVELLTVLDAHEAAFAALDRIEDALTAAHGHPRVPLPPLTAGTPLDRATDVATIRHHFGPAHPDTPRLVARLRHRRRSFDRATRIAGIARARTCEARAAHCLDAATSTLLHTPAVDLPDLATKLAVIVATGELGPSDAHAFKWAELRALHAELQNHLSRPV